MAPPADLLTVAQVAERLGVGVKFVQRRTKNGEIPSYKLGRAVRVSEADLDEYMRSRYSGDPAPAEPDPPTPPPTPEPRRKVRRRPPTT